jgi:hypothetical protein
MGIHSVCREIGSRALGTPRGYSYGSGPKDRRNPEFYRGSQFQNIQDFVDYVRANKELQGFVSVSQMINSKTNPNPRSRQFAGALVRFLNEVEGLNGNVDRKLFQQRVREVLNAK